MIFQQQFVLGQQEVSPPGSLYGEIMADSPAYYFRHAEASGTTMENEVGADGVYAGSGVTLGSTALYTGGPTSVRIPAVGLTGYGQKTGGTLPSLTEMTLMTVVRFTSLSSVFRGIFSCDDGFSSRMWQWRMSGGTMQFVKIVGGVSTQGFATGFTTGTPYMAHVTITSTGAITFYVNGVSVHTASVAAANYGGISDFLEVGYMTGGSGALANAFFSETALFPTALSGARVAAHAAAAGF